MGGDDDRGKQRRGLPAKLAFCAGALGAALLFFLCTSCAQAVSAQRFCHWQHVSNWSDSLDQGNSYTYGSVQCDPIHVVATTCRATIQMGTASALGYVAQRQGCNTSAQLNVRRSQVVNYGSRFAFTLRLVNKRKRWTYSFIGGQKPNRGCSTWFSSTGQHVLGCADEHEDGEYLPGPARRPR